MWPSVSRPRKLISSSIPILSLLPLFPPMKGFERIIAEDLCVILGVEIRSLFGCELLSNGDKGGNENFPCSCYKREKLFNCL